jgi:hypothetical protein
MIPSNQRRRPRAQDILSNYVALVKEGHVFNNGDLNSYLRVVNADSDSRLVESGGAPFLDLLKITRF